MRYGNTVQLGPVTNGSAENEAFFQHTPWGTIDMGTVNEDVIK